MLATGVAPEGHHRGPRITSVALEDPSSQALHPKTIKAKQSIVGSRLSNRFLSIKRNLLIAHNVAEHM